MRKIDWVTALLGAIGVTTVIISTIMILALLRQAGTCAEMGGVDVRGFCIDRSVVISVP